MGEVLDGIAVGIFLQELLLFRRVGGGIFGGRTGIDQLAAQSSGIGTDVDEVVGGTHDFLVVLHYHHCIAQLLQLSEHLDEAVGVTAVETDARLVEDIDAAHERRTETGGQVDALALTSRKGIGEAVEGEVAQTYVEEELEAVGDFCQKSLAHAFLVLGQF